MPTDQDQVRVMKDILEKYAQSTGLKINFHKSYMIPINLGEDNVKDITQFLGCKIASMSFTYLGLPVVTTKPTFQDI
jgi:hypothetical protein